MIDYGPFVIDGPPCPASNWMNRACAAIGLKSDYVENSNGKLSLMIVQHPKLIMEWAFCHERDAPYSSGWKRLSHCSCDVFAQFVRSYLIHCPGYISSVFDSHKVGSVMRGEDMPAALLELLDSFGIEANRNIISLTWMQVPARQPWPLQLLRNFMQAERSLCEQYDYF